MFFRLIQFYTKRFPFPQRGLKYFYRLLQFWGLEKRDFLKKMPAGYWMRLCPAEHQQRQLLWYGEYDAHITHFIRTTLKPGEVFLDIGANIGYYSLEAAQIDPSIRVIAVEPSTRSYQKLVGNKALNPFQNLQTYRLALGDQNGEATLYLSNPENEGMNSLAPPENFSGESESVPMLTADDWSELYPLQSLDLVKIDTEGHEISVLRGMKKWIDKFRPILILEVNAQTLSLFGQTPSDLIRYTDQLGYTAFQFEEGLVPLKPGMNLPEQSDLVFFPQ